MQEAWQKDLSSKQLSSSARKATGGNLCRWGNPSRRELFVRYKLLIIATVLGFSFLLFFPQDKVSAQTTVCLPIGGIIFCKTLPPRYYYPPISPFPSDVSALPWESSPNLDGTYDIYFHFNNPYGRGVSLTINPVQFADPGPYADTKGSSWTFKSVPANSTQYVNMKTDVNGYWSQIVSWTIQVPPWIAPTPIPTPTDSPTPVQTSNESTFPTIPIILLLVGGFVLSSNKKVIKFLKKSIKNGK